MSAPKLWLHKLFLAKPGLCQCCGLHIGAPPKHRLSLVGIYKHEERICETCIHSSVQLFAEMKTAERRRLQTRRMLTAMQALLCSSCERPRQEVMGFLPLSDDCRLCDQCLKEAELMIQHKPGDAPWEL